MAARTGRATLLPTARIAAGLVVLALLAAACGSRPTGDEQIGLADPNAGPLTLDDGEDFFTLEDFPEEFDNVPADAADAGDAGEPAPGQGQAVAAGDPPPPGSGTQPAPPGPQPPSAGGASAPFEADLYTGADNTIGITDTTITLCGHGALVLAEAFDTRPQDLNVYWQALNDAGGIHGRAVEVTWEDDVYNPSQAVQAAEACRAKRPFVLLGGIGFDQIPSVRTWAEANKMLYLHHMAIAPTEPLRYTFSAMPTVEATGRAFGEHIAGRYGDKRVGTMYRQSENWEPGHRSGLAVLNDRGVNVVASVPVQSNQGVYSQQVLELQRQQAEVVWIWENALAAAQIIHQAAAQGYRPKWVVFPFQTTLDTIGEYSYDPTLDGVAAWPAYAPGGYGGAFAEFGLDEEIRRFEAAYARYRPGVETNDILWQTWIGNKFLHRLLDRCGSDCNRNRFAGLFLAGLKGRVDPGCAVDFTRPDSFNRRIGGFQFYVQETFRHSSGPLWQNTGWCSERLG